MEHLVNLIARQDFVDFYAKKRVLITGHTGFKGSWLAIWLHNLGADVTGYSLDPLTPKDNFILSGIGRKINDIRGDIRDKAKLNGVFNEFKPQIVFHLAAQPLVRYSYQDPVYTYEVNVMGTINVLEEIRKCKETNSAIIITTDKCYNNREQIWGYRETDPLGGFDPYSSSKGACEIAVNSWRSSFFSSGKGLATARAGNVIGGGDWAADRIIPDCIRALENDEPIELRNPMAIRPWQHVIEPLSGYLQLGVMLNKDPEAFSEAWNFGPEIDQIWTVKSVAEKLIEEYGKGKLIDISDTNQPHEAHLLLLDITKAKLKLNWHPVWNTTQAVGKTAKWYLNYKKVNVYELCIHQINSYQNNTACE